MQKYVHPVAFTWKTLHPHFFDFTSLIEFYTPANPSFYLVAFIAIHILAVYLVTCQL